MLKSGTHMWALDELIATYPDIGIIQTHRDPVKVATSFSSLSTLVRSMASDEVDAGVVGADWTPRLAKVLERSIDVRLARGDADARFHDVHFRDLLADPMAVVERIYAHYDIELEGRAVDAMRAFIAANPAGKHGAHRYAPEEYGLDPGTERARFARYTEYFGIEAEEQSAVADRVA